MAQLKDDLKKEITTSVLHVMKQLLAPKQYGLDAQAENTNPNPPSDRNEGPPEAMGMGSQ